MRTPIEILQEELQYIEIQITNGLSSLSHKKDQIQCVENSLVELNTQKYLLEKSIEAIKGLPQ